MPIENIQIQQAQINVIEHIFSSPQLVKPQTHVWAVSHTVDLEEHFNSVSNFDFLDEEPSQAKPYVAPAVPNLQQSWNQHND